MTRQSALLYSAGVVTGMVAAAMVTAALSAPGTDVYRQLDLFGDVFERVRADYVEPVDDKEMIESAINGMLTSLDPHSSYLNADDFRGMQQQTKGEFGGLGIEVTMEEGVVKVVAPIDATPASRAGVKSGDYITHLDEEPILGLTLSEAVDKMRGPVGSKIKLRIRREGVDKPIDLTITRDIIKVESVTWKAEGEVGYIRIKTFSEQTDAGLRKGMATLAKEIGEDKIVGYVLDLRTNPGGLLDQAIAVADTFLDEGEIVSTRGRRPDDIQRMNARRGDLAKGKPIIVLINEGSASASEIVAGALKDHRRATILGIKSFGKGSVQTVIPLGGGSDGALRLTTARYYTPSGESIQARGITPDIEVEFTAKPADAEEDPLERPSEAALPNHLRAEGKEGEDPQDATVEKAPEGVEDYQLQRALEILKGIGAQMKAMPNRG